MTRQMLRGTRGSSKEELTEQIYQHFDEVNEIPVLFHLKYKMDNITEDDYADQNQSGEYKYVILVKYGTVNLLIVYNAHDIVIFIGMPRYFYY